MQLLNKYKQLPIQVKASFWFFVCAFLQKAIATISTPIFTRIMTPAEYGQYNVFNSWLGIANILITLCLFYGVYMQGLVKFEDRRKIFSSSLQGLTLFLVVLWSLIYAIGYNFFNNLLSLTTSQMICMFLLIWLGAVFSFWSCEQRVDYKYKLLVTISLIVSFLQPLVGILLVISSTDKVMARIIGLVVVDLICFSWMFFYQMKKGSYKISVAFCKYALAFNIPLVPHYLSQVVLGNSDRIMIGKMVGTSQAGIYSLAYSVALVMTLFNVALGQTVNPWIYKKIKAKSILKIARVIYLLLIFIAVVNLFLIMLAPEIVAVFAPKTYYEAIWTIPPVAMSVYLMFCYDAFAKFAFYYEKTVYIMAASIIGAIVNIILNYLLIPIFGYIVAGYTTLICYLLYVLFHYIFMNKICDKYCDKVRPYNTKIILLITGIFFALALSCLFIYEYIFIRYIIILLFLILLITNNKVILNLFKQLSFIRNEKTKNEK